MKLIMRQVAHISWVLMSNRYIWNTKVLVVLRLQVHTLTCTGTWTAPCSAFGQDESWSSACSDASCCIWTDGRKESHTMYQNVHYSNTVPKNSNVWLKYLNSMNYNEMCFWHSWSPEDESWTDFGNNPLTLPVVPTTVSFCLSFVVNISTTTTRNSAHTFRRILIMIIVIIHNGNDNDSEAALTCWVHPGRSLRTLRCCPPLPGSKWCHIEKRSEGERERLSLKILS